MINCSRLLLLMLLRYFPRLHYIDRLPLHLHSLLHNLSLPDLVSSLLNLKRALLLWHLSK